MSIAELSKDELSRFIAEKMEPKPVEVGGYYDSTSCVNRIANGTNKQKYKGQSILNWWAWRDDWRYPNDHTIPVQSGDWQPRPYDDPEIAMRLLKWLLFHPDLLALIDHAEFEVTVREAAWNRGIRGGFILPIRDNFEQAIAQAVALALGWKEEE